MKIIVLLAMHIFWFDSGKKHFSYFLRLSYYVLDGKIRLMVDLRSLAIET